MPAGKQVLDRIKSVKNTGKITRAMELISTVKMKKAADIALGARPFALEASSIFSRVVDEIAMSPFVVSEKNTEGKAVINKILIVLITSNRGLCGAYNINVFREAMHAVAGREADFVSIGKKAREFIVRTGNSLIADYSDAFRDTPQANEIKSISDSLSFLYLSGEYSEVRVIYSYYISPIAQKPVTRPFLPVSKDTLSAFLEELTGSIISTVTYSGDYLIEPSRQHVADRIVPLILDLIFYEMILEA